MEHTIQESKKQYVFVLILISEDKWHEDVTLPRNFAHNFLNSLDKREKEFVALNPCCFCCPLEIYTSISPKLAETAKVYNVETQILFLDQKRSWITS